MTGKELVLALVGAGVVGGGAGVAASLATAPKPEAPPAAASAEILDRIKVLEGQLAQARTSAEESRRTVLEMQDRVAKAEFAVARQAPAGDAAAAAPGAKSVRVGRHAMHAADGSQQAAGVVVDDGDLGGQIAIDLGDQLDKLNVDLGDLNGQLDAFRNGLKLRQLPEADRWQKAKDDLGLAWNQVEDLKKAVADRDAAMKDAMT